MSNTATNQLTNESTENLIKQLLCYIFDGTSECDDCKNILQEVKHRLGI